VGKNKVQTNGKAGNALEAESYSEASSAAFDFLFLIASPP
jgi:hypothetical protein